MQRLIRTITVKNLVTNVLLERDFKFRLTFCEGKFEIC